MTNTTKLDKKHIQKEKQRGDNFIKKNWKPGT